MIRVLHIVGNMNMGGQETFIMNLYRKIDTNKIQFDFVVHSKIRGYYDDEIENLGGKIYRITPMHKNLIKHCKELYKIFKSSQNYILHRHTCSSVIAIELLLAKIAGIKKIIVHSHSTKTTNFKFFNILFKPFMNKFANIKLACSESAGKFLFGRKQKFEIINNAIDVEKYIFDEKIRKSIREKYNARNKFVIGHVGRFDRAKNHRFILEIFEDILRKKENSELWLIGDGILKSEIEEIAKQKSIYQKIKFLGIKNNVNELMMGMDAFIFPSSYEGLGIVLIEAQTSGLVCTVSDRIQPEAIVTNNVNVLSLNDQLGKWSETIIKTYKTEGRKSIENKKIDDFKIENLVKKMEKIYE